MGMDGISGLFISRPWRPQTRKYQSILSHVSLTDGKMCLEYKQILSHNFFSSENTGLDRGNPKVKQIN